MYFIVNLMCICMKQYICHVWVMQKIIFKITTPFLITLLSNIEYIFWCEVSSLTVTEWIYVPQTHQYELSQSWTVYTIYAADFILSLTSWYVAYGWHFVYVVVLPNHRQLSHSHRYKLWMKMVGFHPVTCLQKLASSCLSYLWDNSQVMIRHLWPPYWFNV